MGTPSARVIRTPRPRWRAYLLLARVSNVPTVWTNTLAGMAISASVLPWDLFARLALSTSSFYIGGMFLNDAFDADIDNRERPERPIPSGNVTRREAFVVGGALIVAGLVLLPRDLTTLVVGFALAAAIIFYDYRHKGDPLAPLVMGICRGLVYCVAASAVAAVSTTVVVAAIVMVGYVTGLTVAARVAGASARWLVPLLIAGISLVDAIVIAAVTGAPGMGALAALGFPATLLLQRVVPGD